MKAPSDCILNSAPGQVVDRLRFECHNPAPEHTAPWQDSRTNAGLLSPNLRV